jgi:CheY-like chemotaxis protein/HPt (histidine-containing phosphotransfer) domain-containing protein
MMNNTESGSTISILLVDDDPLIQKVGRAMLAYCGCRVDIAGNGREALEAFSRQRYDMIFMDCQMPEMDGYEATDLIRERETNNRESGAVTRTPIVALTGYATQQDRERCLQAGMDDYLGKPFSLATLQSALDRWLCARAGESREGRGTQAFPGFAVSMGAAEGAIRKEEPSPLDPKALDMIASIQPKGSDEILKKVIALYLDSSCKLMQGIRVAAEGNDADALHHAAHTLKSSSAYLGAMTLSSMSKELEMMGRDKTLEWAMARLTPLEHEYGRVRDALAKLLDRMTPGPNQ